MSREAVLLDKDNRFVTGPSGQPMSVPVPEPGIRRTAHVSGNQVDVFHCPFCGSGDVVARSDMSIECGFCNSAFTVTISPVYPSFPMSVDGQPYPWPGRPQDVMDPAMMGDPNAAGGGFGGQLIPGGGGGDDAGDGDGDGGGNPFADGDGDESGDSGAPPSGGDDEGTEAEVGGKKKPPFGKKSVRVDGSQTRRFITASGAALDRDDYMRHLAITTAQNPNAVAAKIKEERRG
jgi:hypothetical protein